MSRNQNNEKQKRLAAPERSYVIDFSFDRRVYLVNRRSEESPAKKRFAE
jgi:hypothetical protein